MSRPRPRTQDTNPDRPTGFKALDNQSPENVQLVWDEMDGVDGFKLYYIDPVTEKRQAPQEVGDATTVNAELPPDTLHVLRARGGARWPQSDPPDRAAVQRDRARGHRGEPPPGAPSPSVDASRLLLPRRRRGGDDERRCRWTDRTPDAPSRWTSSA